MRRFSASASASKKMGLRGSSRAVRTINEWVRCADGVRFEEFTRLEVLEAHTERAHMPTCPNKHRSRTAQHAADALESGSSMTA